MSNSDQIAKYHLHKQHPEKLQFELYDLNQYRKKSLNEAARPHSHSYYQIIWFTKGRGKHFVDFKEYNLQPNTILFISKDQVHAFDQDLEIEGALIHFNESFFMHSDVDIFLKYKLFKSEEKPFYSIGQEVAKKAETYLDLIKLELKRRDQFGYEEIIRFLLKSFLIILERIYQNDTRQSFAFNSQYEVVYFQFKELLEAHFNEGLSVKDYALLLNISSKTLTTITKQVVGKPPSVIISERLVLEAKRLLQFTSLQISEIAYKLGFDDASYFVKYIKRHLKMSPGQYRLSSMKQVS
ncbi:AraC family transcriptional regulator [Spongiivirga sp. MCCC 1A20706]|uniref:AraC family transcriptional regulator n=1 Tax=Spongiivirga sp. MCCC 1A20706 TaxID=3160963 RepID=UPI0039778B99